MHIIHSFEQLPDSLRNAVVAVGNFDGVHRGHLAVIGEAGRMARAHGVPWLVMTFEPHPRDLFKPDAPPYRLTPFAAKARIIKGLGVDALIVPTFDRTFSQLSAEHFIEQVLVKGLTAGHVVSGYDFAFGNDRKGNCELLLSVGRVAGFDFTAVSAVREAAGEVYSSTRAREAIQSGDMRLAAAILTRPFEIGGSVIPGDQRGRTIGVPTANIDMSDHIRPAYGVYAILAAIDYGDDQPSDWIPGVANIGLRPTVDGATELLEAHLFDFEGDLYGKTLRIKLIERIRDEKKFAGLDSLKGQIQDDIQKAQELLANI